MSSLYEEYRKRHGIGCVWPVNEGVLFFDCDKEPTLVAITSSFTKQLLVCGACAKNSESICLEIFRRYKFPYCVQRITHTHMPPDADLLDYIRSHVPKGEDYMPYVSAGERDQERWLWEFFKLTGAFSQMKAWSGFKERHKPEVTELAWLEEAWWVANQAPDTFRRFYEQLYSICMVNRHYILID
jgi:hypothetical protein